MDCSAVHQVLTSRVTDELKFAPATSDSIWLLLVFSREALAIQYRHGSRSRCASQKVEVASFVRLQDMVAIEHVVAARRRALLDLAVGSPHL